MYKKMDNVDGKLREIFKNRLELDFDEIEKKHPDACDTPLLGLKFGLYPRDLLYIYFNVEKEFGITLPQEEIANGGFSTYNGILNIINGCLSHAEAV